VDNVEILYTKNRYFAIPGVMQLDSAKLEAYIPLYQNVPVMDYITDKKDSLEALLIMAPVFGKIELVDLNSDKSNSIEIYKTPENKRGYYGRIGKTGEIVLVNRQFFDVLMVKRDFFIKR
jgi:hypothetical protein